MGSYNKVKDGIETRVGVRATKHRARVWVMGSWEVGPWRSTRREAVKDRDRIRHERTAETERPAESITLEHGMKRVIEDLERRRQRAETIRDRKQRFVMIRRLIDPEVRLDEIEPRDVEEFLDVRLKGIPEDDLAPVKLATAQGDIRALNTVFTLAMHDGFVRENPIKRARLPKAERNRSLHWFTREELADLLAKIRSWPATSRLDPRRDADIIELLALTGWRLTESSKIQMEDVSIEQKTVVVGEGKTGLRVARLNPDALAILKRWKKERPTGPMFPVKRAGLVSAFRRWKNRLDEPRLHAHAFKHTCGTTLSADGVSAHALARTLAHSSLSTSLIYVHLTGHQDDAVQRLSFKQNEKPKKKRGRKKSQGRDEDAGTQGSPDP